MIDDAFDKNDEVLTGQAFSLIDKLETRKLEPSQSALLHYFRANAWENRLFGSGKKQSWSWEIEEVQNQIVHLRLAVRHAGFQDLKVRDRCSILTNLANKLSTVGRILEAIEVWERVFQLEEKFAVAWANRASGFLHYSQSVYDPGHADMLLMAAATSYGNASAADAVFDSEQNALLRSRFQQSHDDIAANLDIKAARKHFESSEFSLGDTSDERAYRSWVLKNRLFLNPLNDVGAESIAARDILTLPSMTFAFDEHEGPHPPPVIGFYNQLKQEFVSARYFFYEGSEVDGFSDSPHFSDKDVALYNTLDYPSYALAVEKVRVAYRLSYSIFDKIAFFINHYMKVGWADHRVNFRNIWYEDVRDTPKPMRALFVDRENWPLRGLFWLSKDIYESDFKKVMEPEAEALAEIRNFLEHKYFQVHESWAFPTRNEPHFDSSPGYHISRSEFEAKTLHVLKLSRAALIYLSLAVYREEQMRHDGKEGLIANFHLGKWEDEWKM